MKKLLATAAIAAQARWRDAKRWHARRQILAADGAAAIKLPERSEWPRSLSDPTDFYFDCFRYFHKGLNEELRRHRAWWHAR